MTLEQCREHVGDAVVYTPHPGSGDSAQGVILAVRQLPVVKFDNGDLLQCSPTCLELVDVSPDLFGNVH